MMWREGGSTPEEGRGINGFLELKRVMTGLYIQKLANLAAKVFVL